MIDPSQIDEHFDVVVLGSGVAGSTTALSLGAQGLSVCLIEHKQHPRFAIGESTVPSTSAGFQAIAERFGVSELDEMTTYIKSKQLGLVSYPKSHFYFAWHDEGQALQKKHEMVFETYRPPLGPDTHLLRSKLDEYLVSLCPKYNVTYRDRCSVKQFEEGSVETPARMRVRKQGKESFIEAAMVVDATGHAAFGAHHCGLFESADGSNAKSASHRDCDLHTNTRVIYGHFAYDDSFDLDAACGGATRAFRYKRDAGTMHHCTKEGWIWVIPFDNDTVSIGLIINNELYPYDSSIDKTEEFWSHINRYPTIAAHFKGLTPTRSLLRLGRIQLHAKSMAVGRMILAPHATAFVDPLYSTGINLTTRFVLRAVPRILTAIRGPSNQALPRGEYLPLDVATHFRSMSDALDKELELIDAMVWGSVVSWRHFDLWKQYWRIWIEATTRQIVDIQVDHDVEAPLYGAGDAAWREMVQQALQLVTDNPPGLPVPTEADDARAARLKTLLDSLPSSYDHYPMKPFAPTWDIDFEHRTNVMVPIHTTSMMKLVSGKRSILSLTWWMACTVAAMTWFWIHYLCSYVLGTSFHGYVDEIYKQVLPSDLGKTLKTCQEAVAALLTGRSIQTKAKQKKQ